MVTHSRVTVQWKEGLHLRRAASLVRLAQGFQSTIWLRCGNRLADARSILSVIMLCASMGAVLDIDARGEDAPEAVRAVEQSFSADDPSDTAPGNPQAAVE